MARPTKRSSTSGAARDESAKKLVDAHRHARAAFSDDVTPSLSVTLQDLTDVGDERYVLLELAVVWPTIDAKERARILGAIRSLLGHRKTERADLVERLSRVYRLDSARFVARAASVLRIYEPTIIAEGGELPGATHDAIVLAITSAQQRRKHDEEGAIKAALDACGLDGPKIVDRAPPK